MSDYASRKIGTKDVRVPEHDIKRNMLLEEILVEIKKINAQIALITDEEINDAD
ncbi:MAG: hypothetical protein GY774_35660 [Planctomycetes bacterium]|nr:hypothetical protein [Planctomycetota bacterium]